MASPTTLPIARLRAAGCKVSTVIGHWPEIGNFQYSIRVPDSLGDLRERTTVADCGIAKAYVPRISDGHHLIVQAIVPAEERGKQRNRAAHVEVGHVLAELAAIIESGFEILAWN